MPTPTRRALVMALVLALVGALAGALALITIYARHPGLALDMTAELPRLAVGFYPPERAGNEPFAWTARNARLVLTGLDRRVAWQCSARVRGGRGPEIPQPIVSLGVDDAKASKAITNTYDTLDVVAPPRPEARSLIFTISSSTAFVPGPGDTRELGVQVNRVACEPLNGAFVLPPRNALLDAAGAGALFGAALGLIGLTPWIALAGVLLLAVLQALPFASGPAPYTAYADQGWWLAIGTAAVIAALCLLIDAIQPRRGQPSLTLTARAAIAISGIAFYVDMLGLLHPSKQPIDAVFHAHRLERVLSGWYYFTQPVRNAEFPYAIGLYVFAMPFASMVSDHVLLLRLIVCACNALAGALLYWMVVRTWKDGAIGLIAVFLFQCLPLPFTVIGNANLTNAFGQSAAMVAIAAATVWRLGGRAEDHAEADSARRSPADADSAWRLGRDAKGYARPDSASTSFAGVGSRRARLQATDIVQILALTVLAAVALLSHVSTLASFGLTMCAIGVLYWTLGAPALRPQGRSVVIALIVAVIVSIAVYYGHFLNVFLSVGRVSAPPAAAAAKAVTTPLAWRWLGGLAQSVRDLGWPILLLAIVGAWRLWVQGRDRLVLAIGAWGITYVALFLAGTLAPASRDFERYAVEFLSRLDHAISPAVVLLAGVGAIWAWRAGLVPRAIAAILLVSASALAVREWLAWFV